jgi:hypothetical protein
MDWFALASIVAGLVLLLAGRKFFWLAAGLAAFIFGMSITRALFGVGVVGFIISVIIGIVLGWLSVKFIRIAGYIIGALAGAVALPLLLGLFGFHNYWLLTSLFGALIGFLLVRFAFDWGLIVMTVWIGANTIVSNVDKMLPLGAFISAVGFIALFIAGIMAQRATLRKKISHSKKANIENK